MVLFYYVLILVIIVVSVPSTYESLLVPEELLNNLLGYVVPTKIVAPSIFSALLVVLNASHVMYRKVLLLSVTPPLKSTILKFVIVE